MRAACLSALNSLLVTYERCLCGTRCNSSHFPWPPPSRRVRPRSACGYPWRQRNGTACMVWNHWPQARPRLFEPTPPSKAINTYQQNRRTAEAFNLLLRFCLSAPTRASAPPQQRCSSPGEPCSGHTPGRTARCQAGSRRSTADRAGKRRRG